MYTDYIVQYIKKRGNFNALASRKIHTLFPIIASNVLDATIIHTDSTRIYRSVSNYRYTHFTCNHSIGQWVNPDNGATINHVVSI